MLETIKILSEDLDYQVVVFGKDASLPISGGGIVDLKGKTNLLTGAYLQRYSGLFSIVIGIDTGMMHIAGSVNSNSDGSYENVSGNKTISLFGPTNPNRYAPYDPTGRFNIVVQPDGIVTGHPVDYGRHRRMDKITPRMVLEAVERHMDSTRAA